MTATYDPDALNNSKLYSIQDCGEHFRRRYIEGENPPGTLRMKRGSSVHAFAASVHKRQMDAKEAQPDAPLAALLKSAVPSREEARDMAATNFKVEVAFGVTFAPEDLLDGGTPGAVGRTLDHVVDSAAFYAAHVAPGINPVGVERLIQVKPADSDLTIHATLDLVDHPIYYDIDDEPGEAKTDIEIVRDLKTAVTAPRKSAAEQSQQLTFQALVRGAETGKIPDRLALDYLVRTPKRHDTYHTSLLTTRNPTDLQALVERINTAVAAAKAGVFVPAQPGVSWRCSPKWCEFFASCKYVNPARG